MSNFFVFRQVVSDLLSPISELLTSCHLANSDIGHVVLVGGTTKVRQLVIAVGNS
jgi:molecular chaperone DnaK (HSP70)